jgi:hypothetical protein
MIANTFDPKWVKVKDQVVIITTADETCVASPSSLQEAFDTEVGKLLFVFINVMACFIRLCQQL